MNLSEAQKNKKRGPKRDPVDIVIISETLQTSLFFVAVYMLVQFSLSPVGKILLTVDCYMYCSKLLICV